MITDAIIEKASIIPCWMDLMEKKALIELARAADGKSIIEVGSLYGGSTALLCMAAPLSTVTCYDEFSWSPIESQPASAAFLTENLRMLGIRNFKIIEGDSRVTGKLLGAPVEFVFIDGGHSYEYVFSDLINIGVHANVIAMHDFRNPAWTTIEQAANDFMFMYPEFEHTETTGTLAVLRRKA